MANKNDPKSFEVSELDDSDLEGASGGLDVSCPENTNCAGANCVAGCGSGKEANVQS